MEDLRLRATLDVKPRCPECFEGPEMLYLTRGASGELSYNISDLPYYNFADLSQLNFIFKQGKNIYSYKMFDYYVETVDEEFLLDKDYYEMVSFDQETNYCEVKLVENRTGSPVEQGLLEAYDKEDSARAYNFWSIDKHFYTDFESEEIIYFDFNPEETKQFKPTRPEDNILFEIVFRINEQEKFNNVTLVYPQLPIAVFDSLVSKIK